MVSSTTVLIRPNLTLEQTPTKPWVYIRVLLRVYTGSALWKFASTWGLLWTYKEFTLGLHGVCSWCQLYALDFYYKRLTLRRSLLLISGYFSVATLGVKQTCLLSYHLYIPNTHVTYAFRSLLLIWGYFSVATLGLLWVYLGLTVCLL